MNITSKLRDGDKPLGILAAEINPSSGIIAAYSTSSSIYIWSRLRELFREGQDPNKIYTPLKVIYGITANLNNLSSVVILWSPNGKQ